MSIEKNTQEEAQFSEYYFVKDHLAGGITEFTEEQVGAIVRLGLSPVRVAMKAELNIVTARNRRLKSKLKSEVESMGAHWSDRDAEVLEQRAAEYRETLEEIHWLQLLLSIKKCPGHQEPISIILH